MTLLLEQSLQEVDHDKEIHLMIRRERAAKTIVVHVDKQYGRSIRNEAAAIVRDMLANMAASIDAAEKAGTLYGNALYNERSAFGEFSARATRFCECVEGEFGWLNYVKKAVIRHYYLPSYGKTVVNINVDHKTAYFGYLTGVHQLKKESNANS